MAKSQTAQYKDVDAAPVKSFFVSMLTRDIKLADAILDLLDNCVDGIIRSSQNLNTEKPYKGFLAEISYDGKSFSISDNCGGIPWELHEYAFRMGRADDRPVDSKHTVGVYGIGMKRAIFKLGKHCLISTQNKENRYEVEITPEWIEAEGPEAWKIPVKEAKKERKEDGTTIVIGDLYPGIKERFKDDVQSFTTELTSMIATHYAFIIDKGFEVKINGKTVKPKPTKLVFDDGPKDAIKPFIFQTEIDSVEVFLAIGFTRPIPGQDEVLDEQKEKQYSSIDAGWTVVCNDRAVLYCDRTELTGWGEASVPRYHTQFIAISGIVEFKASDASKLPTTTTKRGIEASDRLYLQVKNKMREGMLLFIDYTNKWKGQAEESKKHITAGKALSLSEIKQEAQSLKFSPTHSYPKGNQFKPKLPLPKKVETGKRRISYTKNIEEVKIVSSYLFDKDDINASEVGEQCFDLMLKEAQ